MPDTNIPDRVVMMIAIPAEDGPLHAIVFTDRDEERAIPVYSTQENFVLAMEGREVLNAEDMASFTERGLVVTGVDMSIGEAVELSHEAGADYMGLDIGIGNKEYRTFRIHEFNPSAN